MQPEKKKNKGTEHMAAAGPAKVQREAPQVQPPTHCYTPEWTITLAGEASDEAQRIMNRTGYSVEQLIEVSIGLIGLLVDAPDRRRKILITTQNGSPLEQIVLPEPVR